MKQFCIDNIKLYNYRRFSKKTFSFDKRMNVLIGSNSSGKTTVLDAACVTLGAYLAAYKNYVPSRFVRNISESDVCRKTQSTSQKDILISSGIEQYPCSVEAKILMDGKAHSYKRILEKKKGRTKFDGSDASMILPLVLYLSSARLWNENKNSELDYNIPNRADAYHRCLDKNRGMQMPFNYIRHLVEVANQEKGGIDFPAYTLIMNAIKMSMEDELPSGDEIEYSLRYGGLALVKKDGTWIPFEGLSDGYRRIIKIVVDIAARMCILNPYLKEETMHS